MRRILNDTPGPGQAKAAFTICLAQIVYQRGSTIGVRWVPGHRRVEGNEQADQDARGAAESGGAPNLGCEKASLAALEITHRKGTPTVEREHSQAQPRQKTLQRPREG